MRNLLYVLVLMMFLGCKKDNDAKVSIYMLTSHTSSIDRTTFPVTVAISNAVLADTPLVTEKDIVFYMPSTTTFYLDKDIRHTIRNYGPDKAFAVTVGNEVVYYGKFHPLYLSSITFGMATISPPLLNGNELRIDFVTLTGSSSLLQLDKRNDSRIIYALKATGRLR